MIPVRQYVIVRRLSHDVDRFQCNDWHGQQFVDKKRKKSFSTGLDDEMKSVFRYPIEMEYDQIPVCSACDSHIIQDVDGKRSLTNTLQYTLRNANKC